MTNGNDEVFGHYENVGPFVVGLTKREHFAAMAMQGILANANWIASQINDPERLGQAATLYADGLIEALNADDQI